MGYLGRRIGLSQDSGDSNPGGADGAVGGGILDLFAQGYFNREGNIFNNPAASPTGISASGGVINDYSVSSTVYRAHIFTASGTFEVSSLATGDFPNNVEYLVVGGGGGGGGSSQSGGGGAGGFRTNLTGHPVKAADYTLETGTYTVTVGAGGRGSSDSYPSRTGTSGGNSEFYPTPVSYPSTARVRSDGGGGGKGYAASPNNNGIPGGSGGGAFNESGGSPTAGASITDPNHPQPQGNVGGISPTYVGPYAGGGGGGAGRAGAPDNPSTPLGRSTGGYGRQCLIAGPPSDPQPVGAPGPGSGAAATGYFAGGGAGGSWPGNPSSHAGGYGGGGTSPASVPANGVDGALTSGGGGSGSSGTGPETPRKQGGNGGSGVVVLRYVIGTTLTAKATGGAISFYGGKTIHTFTGSGTFATTSDWDNPSIEYVIVGGGGGGGGDNYPGAGAGGGGAGGYLTGSVTLGAHPNSTTITIGSGGLGGPATSSPANESQLSTPGGDTTAAFPPGSKVAGGGGRGGGGPSNPGGSSVVYYTAERGASGGGGNGYTSNSANAGAAGNYYPPASPLHPSPAPGQGNDGGSSPGSPPYSGAGGGGSGAAGESNSAPAGGHGGQGTQLPTTFRDPTSSVGFPGPGSTKHWIAGGGGGGSPGTDGAGGSWDGSALLPGGPYAGAAAGASETSAESNSGSGGGGGCHPVRNGSNGGSGIVLIAYPT